MTLQELRGSIDAVFSDGFTVQVYLILKMNQGYELRLADIESDNTEPEIRAMFCDYVNNSIVNNGELEICELSTADERINAIYHYDYEAYPEELELFQSFDITQATSVDGTRVFNFNSDDLSTLSGYIIYLGSMKRGIVLLKKHYPISLIKRDSFLLGFKKDDKRFVRIDGEDILRLNGIAQMMRINNEVFVMDTKVLERNFGFTQLIRKAADYTIQAISNLFLLEDIQILRDAIEDVSFARKLSKVKNNSPILKHNIPKAAIIEFTKTNPALVGRFKYSTDETMIRLDTNKSKEAFIQLMNDAFLHSQLTNQYYEAKAKDTITTD